MNEGSRLSRWSQRKLAAKQVKSHGGALPEPADVAAKTVRPDEPALPLDGDRNKPLAEGQALKPKVAGTAPDQAETMLTEADLPPIEGLTAQSDYTVFLKNNVPEALRKAALRKLWVSDPILANLDGLNDYCEDFSIVTAMTMDDTSYKIGRGLLGDEAKPELKPELEPESEPALESEADKTGESLSARAEQDNSPSSSEHAADEAADTDSDNGYSDAPPFASSEQARPVGGSEPDKA
jgi:hypothetical protein